MVIVPDTVGVKNFRNRESRAETTNGTIEDMTTNVASNAGPPVAIAVMQMAINVGEPPKT